MKKIMFLFAATLVFMSSVAQNVPHRTTVYVDITVDEQEIIAGPYARYAQKYLGVAAPLADKVLYGIRSVKISDINELPSIIEGENTADISHMNPERGFPKLSIDKSSGAGLGLEESASLAAAKIFEIRKSRYELITGEAGENVFGAGLGDALNELNRLEQEYLALFLGRQTNTVTTRQYRIVPTQDKLTYIVCRFTQTDGLLPEDDLSGMPIVLELKPSEISTEGVDITLRPSAKNPAYHITSDVQCRIIVDGTEITSTVIPVYQFGKTVYLVQ